MGDRGTQLPPAGKWKAGILGGVEVFSNKQHCRQKALATARMQIAAREIVLWTTPSEPPKALQASECSELLDPMRASCLILAQHQPGKLKPHPAAGARPPRAPATPVLHLLAATTLVFPGRPAFFWPRRPCLASLPLATTRCWGQSPAKIKEFTLLRSFHGNL